MYPTYLVPYGSLNLSETSPAQSFEEPMSLAEAKAYCKLPLEATDQDDSLLIMISAARAIAETAQGRDLVRKQWDLSLDYWPCGSVIGLRDPLVSVDLVQYKDSAGATVDLVENTDYIVDRAKHPGVMMPAFNTLWPSFTPWPSSAVTVRFTAGRTVTDSWWTGPGSIVKIGMGYLINEWFTCRLPYVENMSSLAEIPYGITMCLSYGALQRVK